VVQQQDQRLYLVQLQSSAQNQQPRQLQEAHPKPSVVEQEAADFMLHGQRCEGSSMATPGELTHHPSDNGTQGEDGGALVADSSWHHSNTLQIVKHDIEQHQSIGEPGHIKQQLKTAREVQKTWRDVTKDCQFDDTPIGTDKCEQLTSHRKSTFPKSHPYVKYELLEQGMVSKYGYQIKLWTPFLEYDKSVVIKLLTECVLG
jgi:hypothetical protein